MLTSQRSGTESVSKPIAKLVGLGGALAISAQLMAVAIQSPSYWWLGWLTLLPLFLAIRVLSPLRALAAGSFWGACFCVLSLIGGEPAFAPTLSSFVLLSAIPGIYAGLGSIITRRVGFSPLMLGLGWVGVEFALHPLALHNGLLAGTQGDGWVVRVVGNVAGYVLVAFLVAYVTAALLSVLTQVYAAARSLLPLGGAGRVAPKAYLSESAFHLLHFIGSLQPRAPPA